MLLCRKMAHRAHMYPMFPMSGPTRKKYMPEKTSRLDSRMRTKG